MPPRLLILRTGSTAPEARERWGDYDRWFTDALAGSDAGPFEHALCDVTREPIPSTDGFAGVIVTGSTNAAYRHEPWMDPLSEFLRRDATPACPVLCVCFGSQILAKARGGRVVLNPTGWEIGAVEVTLTPQASDDPLFSGAAPAGAGGPEARMMVLATHEDRIEAPPAGATLLAGNEGTPIQAYRVGDSMWGVQFHPEITTDILAQLIRLRAAQLERDARARGLAAEGHVDRLLATLRDPRAAQGRRILDRFARLCARRAPAPGR